MKKRSLIIYLLLTMALAACAPQSTPTPAAVDTPAIFPTPTEPPSDPLPPIVTEEPRLSEAQLRNLTVRLPVYEQEITLQDGRYEGGPEAVVRTVALLPQIAWGDLNGDGLEDAVMLLAENGGGSGTFVSLLAVLNQGGQPLVMGAAMIDDRPRIHSLAIQAGEVVLGAAIHRASDPMVSPTLVVTQTYRLETGRVELSSLETTTPAGAARRIILTSPAWGAQVSGSIQVSGNMPIGPFENNLVYRLTDVEGNLVAEGPFNVQSDGLSGPATFENQIELPPGGPFWLELLEQSMEDGSPLALIRVIVKP